MDVGYIGVFRFTVFGVNVYPYWGGTGSVNCASLRRLDDVMTGRLFFLHTLGSTSKVYYIYPGIEASSIKFELTN